MGLTIQKHRLHLVSALFDGLIDKSRFSWVDQQATEKHFPLGSYVKAEREVQIVHFDEFIESDDTLNFFKENKLCSGSVKDLLTFTATFQTYEFPLVLLGSRWYSWEDHRLYVLFPRQTCQGRHLGLAPNDYPWSPVCRFLAVPQNSY